MRELHIVMCHNYHKNRAEVGIKGWSGKATMTLEAEKRLKSV